MPAEVAGYVCNSFDRCLVMRGDDHSNIGAYRLCSECVCVCVDMNIQVVCLFLCVCVWGGGGGVQVCMCVGGLIFFKGCVHNYPANS